MECRSRAESSAVTCISNVVPRPRARASSATLEVERPPRCGGGFLPDSYKI